MEEKNELIKTLLEQGKITFEQATLLSQQEEEDIKLRKLINDVYDDLINISDSKIDVKDIVHVMKESHWTWYDRTVTESMFKSHVLQQVTDVVSHLYNLYKICGCEDDKHYFTESCGTRVEGILYSNGDLDIDLKFIYDSSTTSYNLEELS